MELSWCYCITAAPRNLQITPRRSTYQSGDRIQCSADGNPEPSYQWTDLVSGTVIQGDFLVISEDMVNDSYEFRCTASNYFNRTLHNESTTLNFSVLPSPSSTGCKQKFRAMWLSCVSHFYRATRMHSADYAVARCLSVRQSVRHTPVLCVNGYTYTQSFLHHRIDLHSIFSVPNGLAIFRGGPSNGGVECKRVWKNHDQYRALSRNWCKIEP